MKANLKAYAWFLGFTAVTAILVVPLAQKFNVPFIKDL